MSRDHEAVALADLRDWTRDETRWATQGGKVKGAPATLTAIRESACDAVLDQSMPLFGRAINYRRAEAATFALGDSHPLLARLREFIATGHGESELRADLGDAFLGLIVDSRFAVERAVTRGSS